MPLRSDSMRARIRRIEECKSVGGVTLFFSDGSQKGYHLSRNDRLKILLAAFDIARDNPDVQPTSTPAALNLARLIGKAERVVPESRLWDTVAGLVNAGPPELASSP